MRCRSGLQVSDLKTLRFGLPLAGAMAIAPGLDRSVVEREQWGD